MLLKIGIFGATIRYKILFSIEHRLAGVPVEKVPAPYTSKSCCKCGAIGSRNKHHFSCKRCNAKYHSDWGASQNIGKWLGKKCSLVLEKDISVMGIFVQESGAHGTPLN